MRVVSNRREAYGLQRAQHAGIPTAYCNLKNYGKQHPELEGNTLRDGYDKLLADLVMNDKPHLLVLAGFMHVLSPSFLEPLVQAGIATINLHPSLPNLFNGMNAIERAYQASQDGIITKTGVMIHYVIAEVTAPENFKRHIQIQLRIIYMLIIS